MDKGASISKYYKSFSGTDTIAFLIFPGINPITIGSLTTVSYSMYRNKVPVINIGRTNINGITRGSRIYAGTMVFTLINKHWLRELQDQASYLKDYPTLKTDELPLFDIMIVSANEYGSACTMFIYGVDFTDEAQTISIEDLFTENVFKFVAREVSVFDEVVITEQKAKKKYYTLRTRELKNYYVDEQQRQLTSKIKREKQDIKPLSRTLYLRTNETPMIGEDIAGVQQLLNMALKDTNIAITYKFDRMTDKAVRDFQTTAGLIVNGIVDNGTYTKLLQYTKAGIDGDFVQVINKSGAYCYKNPDVNTSITKIYPYLASVEVFKTVKDLNNGFENFYETKDGYISTYDVYRYINNTDTDFTLKQLKYGDIDTQVTVLQNILENIYPNFSGYENGTFDEKTENYLKKFQSDNQLIETGICDNYTWNILLNKNKDDNYKQYIANHSDMQVTFEPGVYNIDETNLNKLDLYQINIYNKNPQQVKYSVISQYKDGYTKTDNKVITYSGSQIHTIQEFENMFKDDIKHRKPTDVYYIVYPYGSMPYKWHFKIT